MAKKTSLKKWIHATSNYVAPIPSSLILWMLANFLEADSKGLYQSSAKGKKSCSLVFPSSTNREIGQFHVLVVQWRQRNVQKSLMHVQSCCFANLNLLFFCRSRWPRRRPWLSSLMIDRNPSACSCPWILRAVLTLSGKVRTAAAQGGTSRSHTSNIVPARAVGREGLVH